MSVVRGFQNSVDAIRQDINAMYSRGTSGMAVLFLKHHTFLDLRAGTMKTYPRSDIDRVVGGGNILPGMLVMDYYGGTGVLATMSDTDLTVRTAALAVKKYAYRFKTSSMEDLAPGVLLLNMDMDSLYWVEPPEPSVADYLPVGSYVIGYSGVQGFALSYGVVVNADADNRKFDMVLIKPSGNAFVIGTTSTYLADTAVGGVCAVPGDTITMAVGRLGIPNSYLLLFDRNSSAVGLMQDPLAGRPSYNVTVLGVQGTFKNKYNYTPVFP
jgi:hypothetical protein